MYNTITESLIRSIPQVSGYDNERLPQSLSRVYARIISLKTKYEDGTLPFNNLELERDYQNLERLSGTLELYLIGNKEDESRKAVAYVAATGRKLMGMIRKQYEWPLTLGYIPVELYAALLYVISGNLADAKEVAERLDSKDAWYNQAGGVIECVKLLTGGRLKELSKYRIGKPDADNPLELAEQLLWAELIKGIKQLGSYLQEGTDYNHEAFARVSELSSYEVEIGDSKCRDIYTGTLVLSKLLTMAAKELIAHALMRVETPNGVNKELWYEAKRKQINYRPYLWDNHIEAIRQGVLDIGTSAVITFPTGAGKTTLSELKIAATVLSGRKVIYLVPTHALEDQVWKSMRRLAYMLNEPIVNNRDGEYSEIEGVDEDETIRVMTPEHCLASIRVRPEELGNVGLVVFDEFHLMSGDETKHRAIDSMLLMTELLTLRPNADYLLISAMVSNGNDVAQWIEGTTRRKCLTLDDPWKPTSQLQGCVVYNYTRLEELSNTITIQQRNSNGKKTPPQTLQRAMTVQPECLFSLKTIWDTVDVDDYYKSELLDHQVNLTVGVNNFTGRWRLSANYNQVAVELAAKYAAIGLKTIIFALDPKSANSINKSLTVKLEEDKTGYLYQHHKRAMSRIGTELGGEEYSYLAACQSATLHHSNLLPEERTVSEDYFINQNGVKVMVATPTIAQGINLPADVVLIAGSARFNERSQGMEQIDAHEILNAAGRAGRAGMRSHGTAILIPSRPIGMINNQIDKIWRELKDDIFSKGDRCLEVEDPLEHILNAVGNEAVRPQLYRMQDEEERLIHRISNSFYAYKMRKTGQEKQLDWQIDQLVAEVGSNKSENPRLRDLVIKTHLDEGTVTRILNEMTDRDAEKTLEMSVSELLEWITEMLCNNYELMDTLLVGEYAGETTRKVLSMGEKQAWDERCVKKLFELVSAYIKGESFLEMEQALRKKTDVFLKNARTFVLKVIPAISYMCGTIIQMLLAWHEDKGVSREEISSDIKAFASCVKEGVTSYDMLMMKYRGKLMRVECHNRMIR